MSTIILQVCCKYFLSSLGLYKFPVNERKMFADTDDLQAKLLWMSCAICSVTTMSKSPPNINTCGGTKMTGILDAKVFPPFCVDSTHDTEYMVLISACRIYPGFMEASAELGSQ